MGRVLETMRVEQRKDGPGPYSFKRSAFNPTDSLVNGIGNPVEPVGLIASCELLVSAQMICDITGTTSRISPGRGLPGRIRYLAS
jgi:hypothetical protein